MNKFGYTPERKNIINGAIEIMLKPGSEFTHNVSIMRKLLRGEFRTGNETLDHFYKIDRDIWQSGKQARANEGVSNLPVSEALTRVVQSISHNIERSNKRHKRKNDITHLMEPLKMNDIEKIERIANEYFNNELRGADKSDPIRDSFQNLNETPAPIDYLDEQQRIKVNNKILQEEKTRPLFDNIMKLPGEKLRKY